VVKVDDWKKYNFIRDAVGSLTDNAGLESGRTLFNSVGTHFVPVGKMTQVPIIRNLIGSNSAGHDPDEIVIAVNANGDVVEQCSDFEIFVSNNDLAPSGKIATLASSNIRCMHGDANMQCEVSNYVGFYMPPPIDYDTDAQQQSTPNQDISASDAGYNITNPPASGSNSYVFAYLKTTPAFYGIDVGLLVNIMQAISTLNFNALHGEGLRIAKAWMHLQDSLYKLSESEIAELTAEQSLYKGKGNYLLKSVLNEYGEEVPPVVLMRNSISVNTNTSLIGSIFGFSDDPEFAMNAEDYNKVLTLDLMMEKIGLGSNIYVNSDDMFQDALNVRRTRITKAISNRGYRLDNQYFTNLMKRAISISNRI